MFGRRLFLAVLLSVPTVGFAQEAELFALRETGFMMPVDEGTDGTTTLPRLSESPLELTPLRLGGSMAYGGFSIATEGALFWTSYFLLDRAGMPPTYNQLLSLEISLAPMMVLLGHEMKREGVTWDRFGDRMRFRKTRLGDWGWAALAVGVGVGASIGLSAVNDRIHYPIPDFMHPALTPDGDGTAESYRSFIGSDRIQGNWGPPVALTVGNQLSVTAEELYWRGLLLPRMEMGLGKWAWVVQGMLWAPSHVFKYWEILPLFAATLPLSALGQKTKNTTVVYVTHTAINLITGVGSVYLIAANGYPEVGPVQSGDGASARRRGGVRRVELLDLQGRF